METYRNALWSVLISLCILSAATAAAVIPFSYWKKDFLSVVLNSPQINGDVRAIARDNSGGVFIGGDFNRSSSYPGAGFVGLTSTGAYNSAIMGKYPGGDDSVLGLCQQADGKLILVGRFTAMGSSITVRRIIRLNTDGSMDTAFQTNVGAGANTQLNDCAVQSDGKIILVGQFTTFNGTTVNRIVRLNSNGTRDTAFTTTAGTAFDAETMAVTVQSDGKILVGGSFTSYKGNSGRNRIIRLNTDGSEDSSFLTNVGTAVNANSVRAIALQSTGQIIIAGKFTSFNGTAAGGLARLSSAGVFDTTFNTNIGAGIAGGGAIIYAAAVDSSDRIIIGGDFTSFSGSANYLRLARLSSAGVVDATLTKTSIGGGLNGYVYGLGVQSDGKIIITGDFSSTDSGATYTYKNLARINSGGSLDTGFDIIIGGGLDSSGRHVFVDGSDNIYIVGDFYTYLGNNSSLQAITHYNSDFSKDTTFSANAGSGFTGGGGAVDALAVQSDGKVVVGGEFTTFNGTTGVNYISRLNANGTLDTAFKTAIGTAANNYVRALALNTDGTIVLGGEFTTLNGSSVGRIAKLSTSGALDTAFRTNTGTGFNDAIKAIVIQSDGKIVVGGYFSTFNGTSVPTGIARLNADGTLDTTFSTNAGAGTNGYVTSLGFLSTGEIIVGGSFSTFKGTTLYHLAKLATTGTPDATFTSNVTTKLDGMVNALSIQAGDRIVLGGDFTVYGSNARKYLLRLNLNGTFDSSFRFYYGGSADNTVNAVNAGGKYIYVGGYISNLGNMPATRFGALE